MLRATPTARPAALDRVRAIGEVRWWLVEEERHAVVCARLARTTWAETGDAAGTS